MDYRIITDSAANMYSMEGMDFKSVPLKIITDEREYIDDGTLDTKEMMEYLDAYTGKSGTSCPNVEDWMSAFEGAKAIFALTISGALSGSYAAAIIAKKTYEEEHPDVRIYVLDSLAAGSKMALILEKIRDDISKNMSFDDIVADIEEYKNNTGVLFMLESLKNLARNGRITPVIAALAGVLGIRVIGRGSEKGTIEMVSKSRGAKKALINMLDEMIKEGFKGGKVHISHCHNEEGAINFGNLVKEKFPYTDICIRECGGLCSFYAQMAGIIVGFEM